MTVTIDDIELARRRLDGIIEATPLIPSATLSRMLDAEVFIKPENLQKTGSFKIRGAYNRIAALSDKEKTRGVIAASAGNHGQALAYAATRAGVKATIVMPEDGGDRESRGDAQLRSGGYPRRYRLPGRARCRRPNLR